MEYKKSLGQHFLKDKAILKSIQEEVNKFCPVHTLIEVGPGMGALTEWLIDIDKSKYYLIEKDDRFVKELPQRFPNQFELIHDDVLKISLGRFERNDLVIVGNFPYNISNLIVFWMLEQTDNIYGSIGMFQKEVGKRICSSHGSKEYGILSVLTQSLYETSYLFDIPSEAFDPPPRVISGLISLRRREKPMAEYHKLKSLVKMAFNQRRKMLGNSLKSAKFSSDSEYEKIKNLRPEQLSVEDFCHLSKFLI